MRMPIALLIWTPLACVGCALAEDAIFELARTGDIKGLQKEVARGTDVNSRDRYGCTPLMYAVKGRQVRLCEFLLANGADVGMKDRKRLTALDYVSVLVRQAKQRTQQPGEDTDRDLASLLRIQALLQQAQAKQRSPQKNGSMSLVVGAIDRNELSELERLVKQGFDINEKGPQGMTALAYAASVGNVGACELLLRRGADLHIRDSQGLIAYGHIERGKTEQATKARLRALFKTEIRRRDLATVKRLIKGGLDINARDKHGRTPLMRAAARGNVDACQVMLDHGADAEARDRDGLSVRDYVCKERGDEEARARIVELLDGAKGPRRPRR